MISRFALHALSQGKLSVFLFHKVPRQCDQLVPSEIDMVRFENFLDSTLSNFNVLPLEEGIARLQAGTLPRRAACITFDDGYPDWLTGVAPALRRRNLHATFFITTGQFDGVPLWHERILAAVRRLPGPMLDMGTPFVPTQPVASTADRQRLVQRLEQVLKYLTLSQREQNLQHLEALAGVRAIDVPVMTEAQLRGLHSQGFDIGAHTALHPILDKCTVEEAKREIGDARDCLQAIIGGAVNGFAYPNGRPYSDFSAEHVAEVKRVGYRYAVTTHWGVATASTSRYQIPRFTPWAQQELHIVYQLMRNFLAKPMQISEVATRGVHGP